MQLRLAGPLGEAEHRAGLGVGVAVDGTQHQRIARAFGQRRDRGLEFGLFDRRIPQRKLDALLRQLVDEVERRRSSTTLTAMRCSQVPNALRASKRGSARQARMKVSWVQSSARAGSRVSLRQTAWT